MPKRAVKRRQGARTAVEDLSDLERLPELVLNRMLGFLEIVDLLRLESCSKLLKDRVDYVIKHKKVLREVTLIDWLFDALHKRESRRWKVDEIRTILLDQIYFHLERYERLDTLDLGYKFYLNQGAPHTVGYRLAKALPNLSEIVVHTFQPRETNMLLSYGKHLKGSCKIRRIDFRDHKYSAPLMYSKIKAENLARDFPHLQLISFGDMADYGLFINFTDISNFIKEVLPKCSTISTVSFIYSVFKEDSPRKEMSEIVQFLQHSSQIRTILFELHIYNSNMISNEHMKLFQHVSDLSQKVQIKLLVDRSVTGMDLTALDKHLRNRIKQVVYQ